MSAAPGWYPDPGGQPGLVRWWDGRSWTAETRPTVPTQPQLRSQPSAPIPPVPRKSSPLGWILGLAAAVVVVVVVIVLLVVNGTRPGGVLGDPPDPTPSAQTCPEAVSPSASPSPGTVGDRVVSGKLSYPTLASPFGAPEWDRRVPFGRDVRSQNATVETDANGRPSWVSGLVLARLLAGDGFYGPQQGAEVVANCITSLFYGNTPVERADKQNKAVTVDGHDAWIIEAHLTFDLPDVQTKGETMTVIVVDTTEGEAGLFYASNPDTSPQFAEPLEEARKGLRVG